MRSSPKIYIAAPYSATSPELTQANVDTAIAVANQLLVEDFTPFCPHLYHFWDQRFPQSYQAWIDLCLAWLPACHGLLRLPGKSPGADGEVAEAHRLLIPVFPSIEALQKFFRR